eukprot:346355-Amphidinium_carterae.1
MSKQAAGKRASIGTTCHHHLTCSHHVLHSKCPTPCHVLLSTQCRNGRLASQEGDKGESSH